METQIITNWASEFTPLIERLTDIATEFIPYLLWWAVAIASINLAIVAVKALIVYIKKKNYSAFYYSRFESWYWKDWTFHAKFRNVPRKKILRNRIRRFR